MKILTIVGARPQFIKATVVSRALQLRDDTQEILLHTGQHFDANMSAVFFDELNIPQPHYNLGIGGGTHGQNTGRMIEAVESVLLKEKPDFVLVYGDTDSTLAGALTAVKLHIPVVHIEAGLRSYNRNMPEELNRVLTDHASDILFAPTNMAVKNLAREGISGNSVYNVGDVMYDAALYYGDKATHCSRILEQLNLKNKSFILATLHRQENVDNCERLANILTGFAASNKPIIMPLHPRTRKRIQEFDLNIPESVQIIEPVGYIDMVMLEKHATLIATDSGGVQKEAYFHKVPCMTLRNETEWVELVDAGVNVLVSADVEKIKKVFSSNLKFPSDVENFYGDGDASAFILKGLLAC